MQKRQIKKSHLSTAAFFLLTIVASATADEKIIQQEKISFKKCLEVITISADKLSIAPETKDLSDQKRVSVFKLIDGTLTITCDGLEGSITVSTNVN